MSVRTRIILSLIHCGLARRPHFGVGMMRAVVVACGLLCLGMSARAGSEALIVVGLTGGETDSATFTGLAGATRDLLEKRGVGRTDILASSESARVTREVILGRLREVAGRLTADDEFWLVLFGHAGMSAGGSPAFQVSGPRLTAQDLREALDAVAAKKFVFVATARSGAFLPVLASPGASVLAATAESGEVNQPRYPEQWVKAFGENPAAPFEAIAARASELVDAEYKQLAVAQGEHARLADPESGKILEPPFGVSDIAAAMATPDAPGEVARVRPEDIEIEKGPEVEGEKWHPPTEETLAIIAEGVNAPNPAGFSALILKEQRELTVESDGSTVRTSMARIYLAKEESVKTWADFTVSSSAPMSITRVISARTILPDGSSVAVETENSAPVAMNEGMGGDSYQTVRLPQAHAGCVIEYATRTENRPRGDIPIFYEELEIQRSVPVLASSITLKVPKRQEFRHRLKNMEAEAVESATEHSRVLSWNFKDLPAFEPLPLDPPHREVAGLLAVSSLASWEEFAVWFLRIAKDSDVADDAVKREAEAIAAAHPSAMKRIEAAFELASSLRYVAIEFGIHGFRPRTPGKVLGNRYGDCKDKANLMVALLGEMGIPAHFVLVNRMSSTDLDFPGWQFNHAIAMVPKNPGLGITEDLWLDSTDTTTPFGFIPPGSIGRNGLVFEGEGARFQVITAREGAVTTIEETWTGQRDKANRWSGDLLQRFTGLADYEQRQQLSNMSPMQRAFAWHQELDRMTSGAEFDGLAFSDVSALAQPVEFRCRWECAEPPVLRPGLPILSYFAPPTRDRPMEINDGQPLTYRQTVRLSNAQEGGVPPPFEREAAGQLLQITHKRIAPDTLERVATCEIRKPRVSAEEYPLLREALRAWNQQLQEPLCQPTN